MLARGQTDNAGQRFDPIDPVVPIVLAGAGRRRIRRRIAGLVVLLVIVAAVDTSLPLTLLALLGPAALAASKRLFTQPTLTFSKADHYLDDQYYVLGASVEPMRTGSSMSQHDAFELVLVVFACNYADAVSTWAFGSRAR